MEMAHRGDSERVQGRRSGTEESNEKGERGRDETCRVPRRSDFFGLLSAGCFAHDCVAFVARPDLSVTVVIVPSRVCPDVSLQTRLTV